MEVDEINSALGCQQQGHVMTQDDNSFLSAKPSEPDLEASQVDAPTDSETAEPRPTPEPAHPSQRIAAVDVLRGVALLGILAMNIVLFGWPFGAYENPIYSGGDDLPNVVAWVTNSVIFSGKMMSLFSMLFGAGLVLMGERAKDRGATITSTYYRRILWLLVIGLIHAYLIWNGDILVYYALCGLLLYFFRRLSPKTLLILGAAVVVVGAFLLFGMTLFAGFARDAAEQVEMARAAGTEPEEWQKGIAQGWNEGMRSFFNPSQEEIDGSIAVYRSGYVEIVRHRAPEVLFMHLFGILFMFWVVGGRMLVGMALMKLRVFSAELSWRFYVGLALFGYGLGLPLTIVGMVDVVANDYDLLSAPWGSLLFNLGMLPVALGHAAVVMMVCKGGILTWLTDRLGAAGRLALTNYLMQSILCTLLFYGYGLGLFGHLDRVGLWGVVFGVWVLQLLISPIWLKYFRYGPAEWLWRSLTYWKWQPIGVGKS